MDNVLNGDCMRGQRFCCVSGLQVLNIFWSFLSFCYFIQNVSFCYFIQDLHIYTKDMSPVSGLCVNQSQRNKICYQEQDRPKQKHITISGLEWPSQCKFHKRDNVTITTITKCKYWDKIITIWSQTWWSQSQRWSKSRGSPALCKYWDTWSSQCQWCQPTPHTARSPRLSFILLLLYFSRLFCLLRSSTKTNAKKMYVVPVQTPPCLQTQINNHWSLSE